MLNQQLRDEANHINRILSTRNHEPKRRRRDALLGEAVEASLRAIPVLSEEPLITDTGPYLAESLARFGDNPHALREELRHDGLLLTMFISTECRLLNDIGVSTTAIEEIANELIRMITSQESFEPFLFDSNSARVATFNLSDQLMALATELKQDLEALVIQQARAGTSARVSAVLKALGGSLVVTADAGATVASHGLAYGAGATSITFGAAMVGQALTDIFEG